MTKATHTPGPWTAEQDPDWKFTYKVASTARTIGKDLREADAHLIAAAPAMLEALQEIVRISHEDYGPACAARMYDAARAAIAKARGEAA